MPASDLSRRFCRSFTPAAPRTDSCSLRCPYDERNRDMNAVNRGRASLAYSPFLKACPERSRRIRLEGGFLKAAFHNARNASHSKQAFSASPLFPRFCRVLSPCSTPHVADAVRRRCRMNEVNRQTKWTGTARAVRVANAGIGGGVRRAFNHAIPRDWLEGAFQAAQKEHD